MTSSTRPPSAPSAIAPEIVDRENPNTTTDALPDVPTLVAISALAYVLAVALHEHAGHSAMCRLLGSQTLEMGAFYSNCDDARLSSAGVRWVAAAGPIVSLVTGLIGFGVLSAVKRLSAAGRYFWWLLGCLGCMEAAGYLAFSGVSGVGDLGTTTDGVFYGATPGWLWRIVLVVVGVVSYRWAVGSAFSRLMPLLSGCAETRLRVAKRAALISYSVGAAVYVAIGALNPHGLQIVLISVLPASLGGTSGLLWMFGRSNRSSGTRGPGLYFNRRWDWIAAGVTVTLFYAAVFGPTIAG